MKDMLDLQEQMRDQMSGQMSDLPSCCPPLAATPLDVEQATELADTLKAIADPTRLRIISLISVNGELCVCDFVEPLGVSQPTVSHHLRTLTEAGVLRRRKDGRWAHYQLVSERIAQIAGSLTPTLAPVTVSTG